LIWRWGCSTNFINKLRSQEWWCTPVILVLRKLRQEDIKLEASLGYIVRPYIKNKLTNKK
jgi:hypothetical protein